MGQTTEISWTDATWTPIRARVREDAAAIAQAKGYTSLVQIAGKMAGHVGPHCEHVSPGCENCYAETNGERCLPANGTGLPFDRRSRDLVEIFLDERILNQPLHWKKPRKIFVCSQTDLFAEFVTDDMIDRVFAVMALCPQHTFQVLTKRSGRMREYMGNAPNRLSDKFKTNVTVVRGAPLKGMKGLVKYWRSLSFDDSTQPMKWPLPNVWLGVSVEDQPRANERIPHLLATPAAIRFLSVEPLLGPVDLDRIPTGQGSGEEWDPIIHMNPLARASILAPHVHWVIVGGESGPGARPCDVVWIRSIVAQCKAAGTACFVKQLGAFAHRDQGMPLHLKDRKGGDMSEWPADLRVREMPNAQGGRV